MNVLFLFTTSKVKTLWSDIPIQNDIDGGQLNFIMLNQK